MNKQKMILILLGFFSVGLIMGLFTAPVQLKDTGFSDTEVIEDLETSTNAQPNEQSNQFTYINEQFWSSSGWWLQGYPTQFWDCYVTIGGGVLELSGRLAAQDHYGLASKAWNNHPFKGGVISFNYDFYAQMTGYDSAAVTLQCYYDGWWHPTTLLDIEATGSGSVNYDISGVTTNITEIEIDVFLNAFLVNTYLRITNLQLNMYEFYSTEVQGDPVVHTTDQTIRATVNPSTTGADDLATFSNWNQSNVWIQWGEDDDTLTSQPWNNMTWTGLNNFRYYYTIDDSNYDYNDSIYYRLRMQDNDNNTQHYSSIFSFNATDTMAPIISLLGNNATQYYNDVLVRCSAADENGGSKLKNVTMYIKQGPGVTKSDTLILSNMSTAIPENGGDFNFTIPKQYLSARTNLYYKIYAIDKKGNERISSEYQIACTDDVVPYNLFYDTSAASWGIENNVSLTVRYNVTEDHRGSGLSLIRLFVKIGSTFNHPNDYQYSIAPIENPTSYPEGRLFSFTVPNSYYNYDQNIYFFINSTDVDGNKNTTYDDIRSVYSNDTVKPWVIPSTSNTQAVGYNISKTLQFTISEPSGASGIDPTSLVLFYKVGDFVNPTGIYKTLGLTGGIVQFTIGQLNYTYGQTLYFQLNVSDFAKNNYSSIVYSCIVTDLWAPAISYLGLSNSTHGIEYTEEFNITFSITEDAEASLLNSYQFEVKNQTNEWSSAIRIYVANTILSGIGGLIKFLINASMGDANQYLEWRIRATDIEGNIREKTGYLKIYDFTSPKISFSITNGSLTGEYGNYTYYQNARIIYNIWEPEQGIGFASISSNYKIYYKIGSASSNPSDYTGYYTTINTTYQAYSGKIWFFLPQNVLTYNQIVWFWVNCTDVFGNQNNTWIDRRYLNIGDDIAPLISMNSQNLLTISYSENKIIYFTPSEPIDASGITFIRLYWILNGNPIGSTTYIDYSVPPQFGGSQLNFELDKDVLGYQYDDYVSVIIEINDTALNSRYSNAQAFYINDTVSPLCVGDPTNIYDTTYEDTKILNFTIQDPDFLSGLSSGIASITFYYLYNNPNVSPSTGTEIDTPYEGSPIAAGGYYSFRFIRDDMLLHIGHRMYYIVVVEDQAGTKVISDVKNFSIVARFSEMSFTPTTEYLNYHDITFELVLSGGTFVWYELNKGTPSEKVYTSHFVLNLNLDDGEEYNLTVHYYDENPENQHSFIFTVDTVPCGPVLNPRVTLNENRVRIDWSAPLDVDSETHYRIYRGTTADFEISMSNLVCMVDTLELRAFVDMHSEWGKTYYYKMYSVDRASNYSEVIVIKVSIPMNPFLLIAIIGAVGIIGAVSIVKIVKVSKAKKDHRLFEEAAAKYETPKEQKKDLKALKASELKKYEEPSEKSTDQTETEVDTSRVKENLRIETEPDKKVDIYVEEKTETDKKVDEKTEKKPKNDDLFEF